MKLMKKLINKGWLFTEVVCTCVLFAFYANSATVKVGEIEYTYNGIRWQCADRQQLTADTLRQHLMNIKDDADGTRAYAIASVRAHARAFFRAHTRRHTRPYTRTRTNHLSFARNHALACVRACIRELSRMLLAQIPADRGGNHNVAENKNSDYTVAAKVEGNGQNCDDIFLACDTLKDHMLNHGHLGYFPMFSVINENPYVKAHKLVPRGIFRVHSDISRRIMNAQRYALNWCNTFSLDGDGWEFFNRLPNYLSNLGFCIDPITPFPDGLAQNIVNALGTIIPRQDPGTLDLTGWTNNLINWLFSTNRIQNVEIQNVENNRFSIDVTYNKDGDSIGLKRDGRSTNTVKIVVQVQNGIISIVTMYPI